MAALDSAKSFLTKSLTKVKTRIAAWRKGSGTAGHA